MNKLGAEKDIGYYMNLPYTITLRLDEEGDFVARVPELPGCSAHGSDRNQALRNLQDVQQAWLEECLESGQHIPEPEPEEELPSGKWLQRVPRTLHKKLAELARKEGVSLNQLVTSMLTEAVTARASRDYMRADSMVVSPVRRPRSQSKNAYKEASRHVRKADSEPVRR